MVVPILDKDRSTAAAHDVETPGSFQRRRRRRRQNNPVLSLRSLNNPGPQCSHTTASMQAGGSKGGCRLFLVASNYLPWLSGLAVCGSLPGDFAVE